jgi:hypothetical protein
MTTAKVFYNGAHWVFECGVIVHRITQTEAVAHLRRTRAEASFVVGAEEAGDPGLLIPPADEPEAEGGMGYDAPADPVLGDDG